ncbi:hypothetical protein [Bacillus sp. PS06]|uniref:hypothetical protein n=1 Tax=Bacillus sp. PS06 TaxID=2764176 RepID=UPI00177E7E5F|nr:hypothetical protein [Bacillus sp. PS06]MBD8067941.1 hypothetical protein [Bacillus sp. PS06]
MELSFGLLLSIVICIYLAIDAPKHGRSPWLWAIFGFIFGPIVLGIYLIVTGRKLLGWIIVIISSLLVILVVLFIVAWVLLILGSL